MQKYKLLETDSCETQLKAHIFVFEKASILKGNYSERKEGLRQTLNGNSIIAIKVHEMFKLCKNRLSQDPIESKVSTFNKAFKTRGNY